MKKMKALGRIGLLWMFLGSAAVGFAADPESDALRHADRQFRSGNYVLALESYERFLRQYPLSERAGGALLRAAICQYSLERFRETRETLRTVETRFGGAGGLETLPYWIGLAEFRLEDYAAAEQALGVFLASTPQAPERGRARLTRALALLEQNRPQPARPLLERFVEEDWYDPQYAYGRVRLAAVYLAAGEAERAWELTEESSESGRWTSWVELYRAEALWQLDRVQEAAQAFRALRAEEPVIAAQAYRRLFELAESSDDSAAMEGLIQSAERDLVEDPQLLRELLGRAGVDSYRRGAPDLAEYFLRRLWADTESPPPESVALTLAEIRLDAGKPDDAAMLLDEYTARAGGDSPDILMRLGDIRMQQGRFAEALAVYRRVRDIGSDAPRAYEAGVLIVYCHYRLGEWTEAIELSRRLQTGDPQAPFEQDLRRLEALSLASGGRPVQAVREMEDYTRSYPDDVSIALDRVKLLHSLGDYTGVIDAARGLRDRRSADGSGLSETDLTLLDYLEGLALIGERDYGTALERLGRLNVSTLESAGLAAIAPYATYYRAWAAYRLDRLAEARDGLFVMIDRYPSHPMRAPALYLAGWILFTLEDYDSSVPFFEEVVSLGGADAERALFQQAKALVELDRPDDAMELLANLRSQSSSLADEAMFEEALILGESGRIDDASRLFFELAEEFPSSELAPEALYRRGLLYHEVDRDEEAAQAFAEYRSRYPGGLQYDGALYFGGLSLAAQQHVFGAVLLWEILIDNHQDSPYRSDAMIRIARAYASRGDVRDALAVARRVVSEDPSRAAEARRLAAELALRLEGIDAEEARLRTRITDNAVRTAEGREAMLALGRILIAGTDADRREARRLLSDLVSTESPDVLGEALFWLGDLEQRSGRHTEAARIFLRAYANATDDEAAAAALYRVAETAVRGSLLADYRQALRLLERDFPDSPWTAEARGLQGGQS